MTEFEKIRVSGLDESTTGLVNSLQQQLVQKTGRNLLRASYYDGKRAVRQIAQMMPPQYNQLGLTLGWVAKGVDLLARRCNLNGFVWPDGTLDSLGYREVWDGNMLASEVDQAITSSLIHATAFITVTTGGPGEPPAMIHFSSALDATGMWDSRRRRLTALQVVTGRDDEGRPDAMTIYEDGVTTLLRKSGRWSVEDRSEHAWGLPVEALPYRPRLGRPFGSSRITRAGMALQDEAVRTVMRGIGHMDTYAWPEYWLLGADESDFRNADGSAKASWQIMLGRIKGLQDDTDSNADNQRAEVKHFPAQSPAPHQAWLNTMAKSFAREMSLPDSSLALTDFANPTSAESYDSSQYELIAEAEGAIDEWSAPLRRAFRLALAMTNKIPADQIPAEWASIDSRWRNPRHLSKAGQADAGMKQLTAVPWLADTEVGLELLGLDEQQIRRAMADRAKAGPSGAELLAGALARQTAQQEPIGE